MNFFQDYQNIDFVPGTDYSCSFNSQCLSNLCPLPVDQVGTTVSDCVAPDEIQIVDEPQLQANTCFSGQPMIKAVWTASSSSSAQTSNNACIAPLVYGQLCTSSDHCQDDLELKTNEVDFCHRAIFSTTIERFRKHNYAVHHNFDIIMIFFQVRECQW